MTNAVDARQKLWAGMKRGDWIGVFLGRVLVAPTQQKPPFWRVNAVHRQVWFSAFHMADEQLPHVVREIRGRGLRFLEGYPSTLFIIAQYLRRTGEQLPMTAVLTSSETLHDVQREAIQEAFCCPIYDFFGHAERTMFAADCEFHAGKHLAEEYGIVEVVDDDGAVLPDGQPGYLVGTSLHNTALPMIRYRTGDISAIIADQCPCGRPSRRIRAITTKAEDIVVTPDGRMISPSILTHPFKPFDTIIKSQIVQDRPDHVLVRIVPSGSFSATEEATLLESLKMRLGPHVTIDLQRLTDIPAEPSGKFRWIISRVPHSCRFDWDSANA